MQVLNCFIQVFMGAVSGYYTNKLAISHLFTDIPLPGGTWQAVIKKGGNKERLAEDLSKLAEDNIIGKNPENQESYLYQELSRPDVMLALDQCVDEIFQELGKSTIAQKSLIEIFGRAWKEEKIWYKLLEKSLFTIAENWKLRDFIPEERFLDFFEELWEREFFPKLSGKQGLELFIDSIGKEILEKNQPIILEDILGKDICRELEQVVLKAIGKVLDAMEQDKDRIKMEGYLSSIYHQCNMEALLREFLTFLQGKKIGEIISIPGNSWFSEKLCFLLEQPKVQENLQILFELLKKELIQTEWKCSDLLPKGCLESEEMIQALKGQIRNLQPFLANLYKENQDFISKRIAQELTIVIEEGTGNFLQNMVLLSAKDIILEKMQEFLKEKLPEKIQTFLEEPSDEFCIEIFHALGNLPVMDLLEKLSFSMVFDYIKKELSLQEGFSKNLLQEIENIPLSFILTNDTIDSLSKGAEKNIVFFLSNWLKGEEKKQQIERFVHFLFDIVWKKPLQKKEVEKLQRKIKGYGFQWTTWLDKHIKNRIPRWIYEKFSEITIKEIVQNLNGQEPEKRQKLLKTIIGKYNDNLTGSTILSAVPKDSLKKKIRELFVQNIGRYLSIKPIVKKKILALDEDMLCTMMQKFMGTQLRPLNQIGGALGAMIGLLLWLFHPSLEISLPVIALSMFCYALIGIGTNVLALRGLFRPYHIQERKWLRRFVGKDEITINPIMKIYNFLSKIPGIRNLFCLGYIPEKKQEIAGQLSSFVADNFLRAEDILPEIKISKEMIQNFLENHKEAITDSIVKKMWKADWESLIGQITEKILLQSEKGQVNIPWEKYNIEDKLARVAFSTLKKVQVSDYINSKQTAKVLTELLLGKIVENQGEILNILQNLPYWEKTVKELFFYDQKIVTQVRDKLSCNKTLLIKHSISCIASLFNENIGEIVEKNQESIEGFFFRLLKQGCSFYVLHHEDELVDKIDLEIQDMMNHMANMPLGGMASSMLGTRQLIAKVFHNLFIEPPVRTTHFYGEPMQDAEENAQAESQKDFSEEFQQKEEVVIQERLNDELFDRNEAVLLEKIGEIIEIQILPMTIKELEKLLFAAVEEKEQAKEDWINNLCHVLDSDKEKKLEAIQTILEIVWNMTIKEYGKRINRQFLEEIIQRETAMIVEYVIQKPSMEQACFDCIYYLLDTYSLLESFDVAAITETSFTSMFQNSWEYLSQLSCMQIMSQFFYIENSSSLFYNQETACFSLIKELSLSLKEKESVKRACREFLSEGLEIFSSFCNKNEENSENMIIQEFILEWFDSINKLFHYQKENKVGLYKVAETVDFSNIIYLAVMDMTDAQIEELLKGFAGQYFLSLKLSGAFGFVFGIPILQWIAVAIAFTSEFTKKKKED